MTRPRLTFDISLGHILTVGSMLFAAAGIYFTAMSRLDRVEEDISAILRTEATQEARLRDLEMHEARDVERLANISSQLTRIENRLAQVVERLNNAGGSPR